MASPILHIYSSRAPYLQEGDKVGLMCPAAALDKETIEPVVKLLKDWGLVPVLGKTMELRHNYFAGTDEERVRDLQNMLDDKEIRAIWCGRGGYGTHRLLDALDFTAFRSHPKWVIGFSDITALHCHIYRHTKLETIHAIMPTVFGMSEESAFNSLRDAIFGKTLQYNIDAHPLNRLGDAKGELMGGNLSVLYGLMGSESEPELNGRILFLEELGEYLYTLDRMMVNLRRAGKLAHLAGLVVGGFTNIQDNKNPFGKTAYEIVAEATEDYDYPVCFDFPAGHIPNNNALILGRETHLNVSTNGVYVDFSV